MYGEQTVKCPICGEPYVVYSHYAGDQSACPDCIMKARNKIQARWTSGTSTVATCLETTTCQTNV